MNFKILAHTHWDREWYFPYQKARVYSFVIFDEIIEYLEKNPDFKSFILDGQTSIIEEYLQFKPNMRERLKKLIKEKRIFTGPWYSQTDTLIVSGESIVRNLLYGSKYAEDLGHSMEIGYLPDSFGMSEQMPQIYRGFKIRYSMFRRGIADFMSKNREFYWESKDRSRVFVHNIYHYGNMAYPPEDRDELKAYMEDMKDKLLESSQTSNIVLFNGEDQKPIRKNLPLIIDRMNEIGLSDNTKSQMVNPEELMEDLDSYNVNFDLYQGELTFGQHSRTHKSIFSTRYDLKKKHNHLENYIVNTLEALLSMGHILGLNYEKESLDYIWKLLLDNQAHDSIGNCNSDITNRFIDNRYMDGLYMAKSLEELKLREISRRVIDKDIFQFQVYNFLAYERGGLIDLDLYLPSDNIEIVDEENIKYDFLIESISDDTERIFKLSLKEMGVYGDINARWKDLDKIYKGKIKVNLGNIPAFGYKTFFINVKDDKKNKSNDKLISNMEYIENAYYKIYVDKDSINLLDKSNGKIYENILYYQDSGDEGDSYDYSRPSKDMIIDRLKIDNFDFDFDKFSQRLKIRSHMNIPYNLEERSKGILSRSMEIESVIELEKATKAIKVKSKILNPSLEHRLRLVFNPQISVKNSLSDQQFGSIERPVILDFPNWKEEGFNEKPRTIEPMQSFTILENDHRYLQVITEHVREYQVIASEYDKLALTLFRSTSYLGKANLNDRPGRESGNRSETFDTRYLNDYILSEHYFVIENEKLDICKAQMLAREILTPLRYYQASDFKNNTENLILNRVEDRDFKLSQSFIKYDGRACLSTIKKSENGDDIIVRLFNPSFKEKIDKGEIVLNKEYLSNIKEVLMNEVDEVNLDNEFNYNQARSFRIGLNRK